MFEYKTLTRDEAYEALKRGERIQGFYAYTKTWDTLVSMQRINLECWYEYIDFRQEAAQLLHKDLPFGTWLKMENGSYARYAGLYNSEGRTHLVIRMDMINTTEVITDKYRATGEKADNSNRIVKVLTCAPDDAPECLK